MTILLAFLEYFQLALPTTQLILTWGRFANQRK